VPSPRGSEPIFLDRLAQEAPVLSIYTLHIATGLSSCLPAGKDNFKYSETLCITEETFKSKQKYIRRQEKKI